MTISILRLSSLSGSKVIGIRGRLKSILLAMCLFGLGTSCLARPVVTKSAREAGKYNVTFTLTAPGAKSVTLAGEFNGWNTTSTPMQRGAGDVFKVTVTLPKGEHPYKFIVDESNWKEDPDAVAKAEDGQGGNNSVVKVEDSAVSAGGVPAARPAGQAPQATSSAAATKGPKVEMLPDGKARVTFTFHAPGAKSVHIAGTFNGWNTTSTPMEQGAGSMFKATLELPKGEHQYKFVIDGSNWREDPDATASTEDGQGGKNSVIRVGQPAAASPGTPAGTSATQGPKVELQQDGKGRVTFSYAAPAAQKVYLAGSFNGWVGNRDEMVKSGDVFTTTVVLDNDEYAYKFVVNGTDWKQDPNNPETQDDGNGGKNSVVHVGAAANFKISEEQVGDGKILADALHHDPASIDYFNPMQDGGVVIKLRAMAHDASEAQLMSRKGIGGSAPVAGAAILTPTPSPDAQWILANLRPEYQDERFAYYRAKVKGPALQAPQSDGYLFRASDKGPYTVLHADGATSESELQKHKPFSGRISKEQIFSTPDWARSVVWYEIFPERFRNGDPKNDPKVGMRK